MTTSGNRTVVDCFTHLQPCEYEFAIDTSGKFHVGIFCEQVTSTPLFTGVREISSSATFIATWGRLRPDGSAGSRRGGAIIYLRGRISDLKNGFEFRACDQNADGISLELVAGASIVIDR